MNVESIPIPSERIPPVATEAAGAAKNLAAVFLVFAAIIVLAGIGMSLEGKPASGDDDVGGGAMLFGLLFWLSIPALLGIRFLRMASRATRAARLAAQDPSTTWRLAGKLMIAADGAGVPRPEVSFKISQKLRTMLLAIPRAELVER